MSRGLSPPEPAHLPPGAALDLSANEHTDLPEDLRRTDEQIINL
jgi:hypothetical protein